MFSTRAKVYGVKPRIYVILRGGLGNQLHQIAAGAAISERVDGVLRVYSHIVDTSVNPSRRGFFREFNLSKVFFTVDLKEVGWFENLALRILVRLRYKGSEKSVVSEENFDHFNLHRKCYLLKGWFQSHKYLPNNFNPTAFVPPTPLEDSTATVHVRLTDFSSIDSEPLNSDYYRVAILRIKQMKEINRFICFSDDIQGAQRMLTGSEEKIYPEYESPFTPDNLLLNMSTSKYLICSRSSLSWWAAQIVAAKGGQVFSPWSDDVANETWNKVEI